MWKLNKGFDIIIYKKGGEVIERNRRDFEKSKRGEGPFHR